MDGGDDPGQGEEVVGEVEGEAPGPAPVPALTEPDQRELSQEDEAAASPAESEREEGPGLAILSLLLARTEVEPGSEVSEGPDPVPQEDGGHLQHPADKAVLDPAEVGVARL